MKIEVSIFSRMCCMYTIRWTQMSGLLFHLEYLDSSIGLLSIWTLPFGVVMESPDHKSTEISADRKCAWPHLSGQEVGQLGCRKGGTPSKLSPPIEFGCFLRKNRIVSYMLSLIKPVMDPNVNQFAKVWVTLSYTRLNNILLSLYGDTIDCYNMVCTLHSLNTSKDLKLDMLIDYKQNPIH